MVKGMAGKVITKNAPYTCKYNILFKIVGKVSKYEKNNIIHNGCWRYGTEYAGMLICQYAGSTVLILLCDRYDE